MASQLESVSGRQSLSAMWVALAKTFSKTVSEVGMKGRGGGDRGDTGLFLVEGLSL